MSIDTEVIAANIVVDQVTGDIDLIVEQPVVIVDVPAAHEVIVEAIGTPGPPGKPGDAGPPGPTAVSADAGNTATLGSDSLIYVPLAFDEATADARYVNGAGDTIPGLLLIDRGPGAGIPLLQFKTNNGTTILSSDGSSYLTFSNGIVVPTLYTSGIGFQQYMPTVNFNTGHLVEVYEILMSGASAHIKGYSDYNAAQPQSEQGFIHRYANRAAGAAPQAAFQAYKDGDPTENPFMISANGYGWLRNAMGNIPVLTLQGSPDQVANVFEVKDIAGQVLLYVGPGGNVGTLNVFNAPIVRVPGIDLWNDGTIYFQAQSVSLGSLPGALKSNSPLLLPGDPTDPLHAATKQYVDAATAPLLERITSLEARISDLEARLS